MVGCWLVIAVYHVHRRQIIWNKMVDGWWLLIADSEKLRAIKGMSWQESIKYKKGKCFRVESAVTRLGHAAVSYSVKCIRYNHDRFRSARANGWLLVREKHTGYQCQRVKQHGRVFSGQPPAPSLDIPLSHIILQQQERTRYTTDSLC